VIKVIPPAGSSPILHRQDPVRFRGLHLPRLQETRRLSAHIRVHDTVRAGFPFPNQSPPLRDRGPSSSLDGQADPRSSRAASGISSHRGCGRCTSDERGEPGPGRGQENWRAPDLLRYDQSLFPDLPPDDSNTWLAGRPEARSLIQRHGRPRGRMFVETNVPKEKIPEPCSPERGDV